MLTEKEKSLREHISVEKYYFLGIYLLISKHHQIVLISFNFIIAFKNSTG